MLDAVIRASEVIGHILKLCARDPVFCLLVHGPTFVVENAVFNTYEKRKTHRGVNCIIEFKNRIWGEIKLLLRIL